MHQRKKKINQLQNVNMKTEGEEESPEGTMRLKTTYKRLGEVV